MTNTEKPQMKYITVVDEARYSDDWPPEPFAEFVAWFNNKVADVPDQYKDTLTVELGTTSSEWGSARIEITYSRLETPEEVAQRLAVERQCKADQEARERALLDTLQQKYGSSE